MNPYTTRTRARIQPGDMARALLTDPSTATLSLAALERIRTYQAETEVDWLLKEHGAQQESVPSRVTLLRQTIGAALVRTGQRLACTSGAGTPPASAPVSGRLRMAE